MLNQGSTYVEPPMTYMVIKGFRRQLRLAGLALLVLGTHALGTPQRQADRGSLSIAAKTEGALERAASKVVSLITRKAGRPHSSASGIILSSDGYIATNHHVLQGADSAEVRFFPNPANSDDYQSFNAVRLLYADETADIAILKVNSVSLPFLECRTKCEARLGEAVYAIGNPRGLSSTVSNGIVSSLRSIDNENFIQHTAAISEGSSGGPLVDADGYLLGMNSWQVSNGQNLNFAIPAKHLLEALASARKTTVSLSFPSESSVGGNATSMPEKAWSAILSKDYIHAISLAEQAVASGNSNAQIYTTLGEGYLARGNEKTAEGYFRQAILIVGPDDEYKQTSRMELLRVLGDRLNAQLGSVDRLAYIRLIDEFTRSASGYWYRQHRPASASDVLLLGDPAGDSRVWVDPVINSELYQELRVWAVSLGVSVRTIVGKWKDKSGAADTLFSYPTCRLEYNIKQDSTGKLGLRAIFLPDTKDGVRCMATGTVELNGTQFTSQVQRMLGTSEGVPIGNARDTVHIEFRMLEDLKTIEGVVVSRTKIESVGPLGKSMADLLQISSKKTWKFTLVRID